MTGYSDSLLARRETGGGAGAMMLEMASQMAELPFWVRLWMVWMMAAFLFGVVFARKDSVARVVLGAFALTTILGMGLFATTRSVRTIAAAHLLVWTPLLAYLRNARSAEASSPRLNLRGMWLSLLQLTITASLFLDLREIALVLLASRARSL